ncbi:hypothetical protein [Marisediminicola sp. LYQ134]|uniref:hypothetical protein n=1 Tax=unclassified Marisediminicola TaxID=2618316 RepID=UPI0039831B5D
MIRSLTATPFGRALAFTVAGLLVVCAILVGLTLLQGPKLSEVQFDADAAVSTSDTQLRMFANQAVSEVDEQQVTITPAAEFTVVTSNDIVVVQFTDRLRFGTDYTVTVAGVTSLYQDRPSVFRHSFATAPAEIHFLDRADPSVDPEGLDRIIRASPTGSDREVVWEGRQIHDFAMFDDILAVATIAEGGSSALTLVSLVDGSTERIVLPGTGIVGELVSAGVGYLGFTFTSAIDDADQEFQQTLFTIDLEGSHLPAAVPGLDGDPIEVLSWFALPTAGEAVVQAIDESVFLIDFSGDVPATPIGSFVDLTSASLNGDVLVVGDVFGPIALTLEDRSEQRLESTPVDGAIPFVGDVQLLDSDLTRVQQIAVPDAESTSFATSLVVDTGSESRTLYESPDGAGSVEEFTVSPNGQYVAVTTVADVASSTTDGYEIAPRPTTVSTVFVDVATGAALGSVDGFDVRW